MSPPQPKSALTDPVNRPSKQRSGRANFFNQMLMPWLNRHDLFPLPLSKESRHYSQNNMRELQNTARDVNLK
jgi:hypothetical protein